MVDTFWTTTAAAAPAGRRKAVLMAAAATLTLALALVGLGLAATPGPASVTFSNVANPVDFGASTVGDPLDATVTLVASSATVLATPNPGEHGPYIVIAANDSVTNWILSATGSGDHKDLHQTAFRNDQ